MRHVADTEIRSEIRSLLVRHRIELGRLQLRITSGTVRITGELCHLGGNYPHAPAVLLETLERGVLTTPGVKHAFLDFANWSRLSCGEWKAVAQVYATALATAA